MNDNDSWFSDMATSTVFNSSSTKLSFLGSSPLSQEGTKQPDFRIEAPSKGVSIGNLWDPPLIEAELSAKKQRHLRMCASSAFQANPGDAIQHSYSRQTLNEGGNTRSYDTLEVIQSSDEGRQKELLSSLNLLNEGVQADSKTFISILQGCIRNKALAEGRQVHSHIIKNGFTLDTFLGNTLINMYVTCGSVMDAHRAFNTVPAEKNVVTWTMLIAAYAKNGPGGEAVKLFWKMEHEGVKPDNVTFVCILRACSSLRDLEQGKLIHLHIINSGIEPNTFVGNTLIDMYAKCGSIQDARQVFDNMHERTVVSWNAMITSYIQLWKDEDAIHLFKQMESQGVRTDKVTLLCVLKACARLAFFEEGKKLHAHIVKSGYDSDVFVASTLVDMYAKLGSLNEACQVFDNIARRDVVAWNAMIAGYAKHGHGEAALNLFQRMEEAGIRPDEVTYLCLLNSCSSLAALQQGKQIHAQILKNGIMLSAYLVSTLIDMYAKCGSLKDASQVFDEMVPRDVVSWNAMIDAYGQHGHGKKAIQLFRQMQLEGIKMDNVSFICVLSACSHGGLVAEGSSCFRSMMQTHGITVTTEHYACMVDLLGRSGHINEAADFIDSMPVPPSAVVWRTLLGACRNQKNVELARNASECIRKLDPQNDAAYVLLSNTYAAAERWEDLAKVRNEMDANGVIKQAGFSWIEVENSLHKFIAEDRSHPKTKEIYAELERLSALIKEAGYLPNTSFVLHYMEQDRKEGALLCHSEKLAIVFGLISTDPGTPVRITKNLRVCGDCHAASKCISQVVGREIIARDASRFHHFKNGSCSCGDYW